MLQIDVWFEQFEFIAIAATVIILAYLALEHKDIVYAAFSFGFMAAFVAGFFLLLEAPFIAGMQIAVYTGGISAIIIFAVLLLPRAQDSSLEAFASARRRRIGMVLSAFVGSLSAVLALVFPWYETFSPTAPPLEDNLELLAQWLWSDHGIYVQLIALVLLSVIVGSIAILKMEKSERLASIKGTPSTVTIQTSVDADPSKNEVDRSVVSTREGDVP